MYNKYSCINNKTITNTEYIILILKSEMFLIFRFGLKKCKKTNLMKKVKKNL